MFAYFSLGFDSVCEHLNVLICISILVGDSLVVDQVYKSLVVTFVGHET